ncbi:MAG: hypothetical protein H6880_08915 [Rhodobiaceae bacterium]|nr:hypothetical protein [Rhodobiaceae bacterium]
MINLWADQNGNKYEEYKGMNFSELIEIFKKEFQDWENLRHAVANRADNGAEFEKNSTKKGIKKNTPIYKEEGGSLLIQEVLNGNEFISMRKGQVLRLSLNPKKYRILVDIFERIVDRACKMQMRKTRWDTRI